MGRRDARPHNADAGSPEAAQKAGVDRTQRSRMPSWSSAVPGGGSGIAELQLGTYEG